MDLQRIKSAVKAGLNVHWMNSGYLVQTDQHDQWFITWNKGGRGENSVGLLEEGLKPENFYVGHESLDYYLDDALDCRPANADTEQMAIPLRYVKVETEDKRSWWVGVGSYLPGVVLDQGEAADLALDLVAEKHKLIPPGQTQTTTTVLVI